ncbi:MAG TPA: hydroxymethylglutaryl-CoA lyase [Alphaproteobacteria bacterium]|nr:MAG: hydroxymethylglutaryl-CoA lyase [SAR116 cluster bacterium]HCY48312.1 hydroxymethylglutaryl-CoA lyase [Alphaproteobacteria bacterium]|tara:strand:- start:4445 stop:5332 length:888 start_codon:yes stop_codon:yes gene_type:complete
MSMTKVTLFEVGPRDGLQNEAHPLGPDDRVSLIKRLAHAGMPYVEAGSFVSPKWVPQMADTDKVLAQLDAEAYRYPVLTPNMKGFEAARAAGADHVAVFGAASETFSQKNINCNITESLRRFAPVMEEARKHNIRIRGYVSCVLGCPYEGDVAVATVVEVAEWLLEHGAHEISLGDTIGVGTPACARAMVKQVAQSVPRDRLALHFHDTYGQALANILACLEEDIRIIDVAVAGLGGCPYAAGASGNVASEDVLYMLEGMGFETGIDLDQIVATGNWVSHLLNRQNNSKVGRARS